MKKKHEQKSNHVNYFPRNNKTKEKKYIKFCSRNYKTGKRNSSNENVVNISMETGYESLQNRINVGYIHILCLYGM